jgi:hypothetical protein
VQSVLDNQCESVNGRGGALQNGLLASDMPYKLQENNIERDTCVGRPWLVLWRNSAEHWIVRGYRTQPEAVRKSATLLASGKVQHTIVTHVLFSEKSIQ